MVWNAHAKHNTTYISTAYVLVCINAREEAWLTEENKENLVMRCVHFCGSLHMDSSLDSLAAMIH